MKKKNKTYKFKFIGAGNTATLTFGEIYFCKEHPHKDFICVLNDDLEWTVYFKSNFKEEVPK